MRQAFKVQLTEKRVQRMAAQTALQLQHRDRLLQTIETQKTPCLFMPLVTALRNNEEPTRMWAVVSSCANALVALRKPVQIPDIQVLVRTMSVHSEVSNVLLKCMSVLNTMSIAHPENQLNILGEGGIAAILEAMQKHHSHAEVQSMACQMLSTMMGTCPPVVKELRRLGGIEIVQAALQKHGVVPNAHVRPREIMSGRALGAGSLLLRPQSVTGQELRAHANSVVAKTVGDLPSSEYKGMSKLPVVIEAISIAAESNKRGVGPMAATQPGVIVGTDTLVGVQDRHLPFGTIRSATNLKLMDNMNASMLKDMRWSPWPFSKPPRQDHGRHLKTRLTERLGTRPITNSSHPFVQRSAQSPDEVFEFLMDEVKRLPAFTTSRFFEIAPSKSSGYKTTKTAFHLTRNEPVRAGFESVTFATSREFGYILEKFIDNGLEMWRYTQGGGQGSMVLVLSPPDAREVVQQRRGEWHILAGTSVVPQTTVLVYAPRSRKEAQCALELVKASISFVMQVCFGTDKHALAPRPNCKLNQTL